MTDANGTAGGGAAQAGAAEICVRLVGVHKAFKERGVLRGMDVSVRRGEVLTILGGSGSGKSVTLKHMIGLLRPDRGGVFVDEMDVTAYSESEWVQVRKRFGYVFQGAALFDSISVYENVAFPLREHERWEEARVAQRVRTCLEAVGLEGVEQHMPAELSGGMRKRVGVARAIAMEPAVMLYDEPTTGLDPANSRRIGELILSLQRRLHVTSVVVTHDLELCFAVSDRVVLLQEGRFVYEGTREAIRASTHPDVVEFLGGFVPSRPADSPEAAPGGMHAR